MKQLSGLDASFLYMESKTVFGHVTGLGIYADGMVEHDGHVGQLLDLLEDLKIADNTIVIYTVDNGPHYNEFRCSHHEIGGILEFIANNT